MKAHAFVRENIPRAMQCIKKQGLYLLKLAACMDIKRALCQRVQDLYDNLIHLAAGGTGYIFCYCSLLCIYFYSFQTNHLQCFDAVGWAAGRASGL